MNTLKLNKLDKNGKEIYLGHTVKGCDNHNGINTAVVVYSDGEYQANGRLAELYHSFWEVIGRAKNEYTDTK